MFLETRYASDGIYRPPLRESELAIIQAVRDAAMLKPEIARALGRGDLEELDALGEEQYEALQRAYAALQQMDEVIAMALEDVV
jgi:hypothetical protein